MCGVVLLSVQNGGKKENKSWNSYVLNIVLNMCQALCDKAFWLSGFWEARIWLLTKCDINLFTGGDITL